MLEVNGKKPPSPPMIIDILSKEYNWTLSEIKNLTEDEVQTYIGIINERRRIENKQYKK